MPFIQIIEYKTNRIDELNAALDAWLEKTKGKRAATRGVQTRDRDASDTYLQIVEFPSHEEAMANSNLPETGEFAAQLAALCDGPPTFRNLEVLREEQMQGAGRRSTAVAVGDWAHGDDRGWFGLDRAAAAARMLVLRRPMVVGGLLRLGEHPEVGVCFRCVKELARRKHKIERSTRAAPAGWPWWRRSQYRAGFGRCQMEVTCAECGCLVDQGVIVTSCDHHPDCCCGDLDVREPS